MVWFPSLSNFPQFIVIHTVKGFSMVNKEQMFFLGLSCFFDDPVDVGNLISGSCSFSKNKLEHLDFHGSRIAEAWLEEV